MCKYRRVNPRRRDTTRRDAQTGQIYGCVQHGITHGQVRDDYTHF